MDKNQLIETDLDFYDLDFKLGVTIGYNFETHRKIDEFTTWNKEEYIDYFLKLSLSKNPPVIYFHNLTFDSQFFINELRDNFEKVNVIRSNTILAIKCYSSYRAKKNGKFITKYKLRLEMRDSLALLVSSIAKLGKKFGYDKLDFDFNYKNKQKAEKYCLRDCEIIYYSVSGLIDYLNNFKDKFRLKIDDIGFDFLPLTIASLSKKIIKTFYSDVFYQIDEEMEENNRKHYFGGRTEVFNFSTVKDAIYFDVNSLYPFVLSEYLFALGKNRELKLGQSTANLSISDILDSLSDKKRQRILAFKADIKENQYFPLFPEKIEGKVFFLNGEKEAIIPLQVYNYLKSNDYIGNKIKILGVKSLFFAQKTGSFSIFKKLYKYRKSFDSDNSYNYFTKILMNSGYGKFGEKPEKEVFNFYNPKSVKHVKRKIENGKRLFFNKKGILFTKDEKYFYYLTNNLLNAILTTSYARFELWKMLEFCRKNEILVYYSDTDSVVIQKNKLVEQFEGPNLGQWDIEAEYSLFQAIDSKEYFFIRKDGSFQSKFKGVPNKYLDEKKTLMKHLENGTKVNLIGSFFYSLNRTEGNANSVYIIHKNKNTYYYKRRIDKKTLETKPLTFSSDKKEFKDEFLPEVSEHNELIIKNLLIGESG